MIINRKQYRTIWFKDGLIHTINQLRLPGSFEIVKINNADEVIKAIQTMVIRGAPAIGAMGAYGLAQAILQMDHLDWKQVQQIKDKLEAARPTAYDLTHGLNFIMERIKGLNTLSDIQKQALEAAETYADNCVKACKKIGQYGNQLIRSGDRLLTHCNAGALATVDYGTALSPMRMAHYEGKNIFVYVDETRPRLQGARLTAWELGHEGIAHAIITDNAAGYFMGKGEVDLVITGADRIAANGDTANKIGTYEKAVVAKENGIPFYIAAPVSTIDFDCPTGANIPIEERDQEEVLFIGEQLVSAKGSPAKNPAFDVTPARYITGFITEHGIFPPEEISDLSTYHD